MRYHATNRVARTGHGTSNTITGQGSDLEGWLRLLVSTRARANGWSTRDLGRAAGIPHITAWRFLTGSSVRCGALLALLDAVGLEVVEAPGQQLRLVEGADA